MFNSGNMGNSGTKRRVAPLFSIEEDILFLQVMENDSKATWRTVSEALNYQHTPRQCRDHWLTQLAPYEKSQIPIKDGELILLLNLVNQYGFKWELIAKHFFERTPIELKNVYLRNLKNSRKLIPTTTTYTNNKENFPQLAPALPFHGQQQYTESSSPAISFPSSPISSNQDSFNAVSSINFFQTIPSFIYKAPMQQMQQQQEQVQPKKAEPSSATAASTRRIVISKQEKKITPLDFNMMSICSMLNA